LENEELLVETYSGVSCKKHNTRNLVCWWESSTLQNLIPNSDNSIACGYITSPNTIRSNSILASTLAVKRTHSRIHWTKGSKRRCLWTNTRPYRAISCENTAQIQWKLLCLPNLVGNFVYISTWCQASLLFL
jgi:hypothetical protein